MITCFGECLLELNHASAFNKLDLRYGGDTYNTASSLRKLLPDNIAVRWVSAIGKGDVYSEWLLKRWQEDGLDLSQLRLLSKALPGIYSIELDEFKERSFCYWRRDSAASRMFMQLSVNDIVKRLSNDYVFFSGISLAILPEPTRNRVLEALKILRSNGCTLIFDPNYRPQLWQNISDAQFCYTEVAKLAQLILASFDDEQLLWGDNSCDETFHRLTTLSTACVVLKNGADYCRAMLGKDVYELKPEKVAVADTSGAGDAFNAGFIAAWITRFTPVESLYLGTKVATIALQTIGAIPAKSHFNSLKSYLRLDV